VNMNDGKRKIQQRFDAASISYEEVATVQKDCAGILSEMLVEHISDFYPSTILDLGTGTGYVPEFLMPTFEKSFYTLNDISPKMIEKVQQKFEKHPQVFFHTGDMEAVDFGYHDVVVSNLALQWVDQLEETLKKLYASSRVLAFSCLLDGTFVEWENFLNKFQVPSPLKKYPTARAMELFFLSLGSFDFSFKVQQFHLKFPNAKVFMHYLQNLGASVGDRRIPLHCLKSIVTITHEIEVSYVVFFGLVRRF
jgi:malonyl-CoA O-methyltransferase